MKRYSIFHPLILSFFSKSLYRDVGKHWRGTGLLYLLVVWRGLKVIAGARDAFSAIAAGGIVIALLFQVFINVGMTIGIAPITGIPLPFVSVGGSAMIANLLAIGVLEAIYVRGNAHRRRF